MTSSVSFANQDIAVAVALDEIGSGSFERDTGFSVRVEDQAVTAPGQFGAAIADAAAFVSEALDGNLYFNIHTADFPGGEIRGQLSVASDETARGVRTITLEASLDAAQEPGPTSDSLATGTASVVITEDLDTGAVSYSSLLTVDGLNEADLLTPIPGVVSAIHLHNAPAGANGPVVQDFLVDAGGRLDVREPISPTGIVGPDVIENVVETGSFQGFDQVVGSGDVDTLDLSAFEPGVTVDLDLSGPAPNPAAVGGEGPQDGAVIVGGEIVTEVDDFENVIGTDGDDLILGNNELNILDGGAGNDAIHSFGGADTIIGGEGIDTALFTAGAGVVLDIDNDGNGVARVNAPGGATLDQVFGFENINGSNNAGSPNGGADRLTGNASANVLNGQAGDDVLRGAGGADTLIGGAGADTLVGGAGRDTFISDGLDTISGGRGVDTVNLSGVAEGVTIDLDLTTPVPNAAATGDEGPQDGAIIAGGAIVVELDNIENIVGTDGDDLILGNNELNILDGGAGNDAIHSFGGADTIIGGEGIDTALFSAGAGVVLNLNNNGDGVARVNAEDGATLDQVFGFENINGSNNAGSPNGGADRLIGNVFANTLNGQVGDDALLGRRGADTLNGGVGDDTLTGGRGADSFVFAAGDGQDTITDFQAGLDQIVLTDLESFDFGSDLRQDGDDTVIDLGADQSVRLLDVALSTLSVDDFTV